MEFISKSDGHSQVDISRDELLIINAALNEVCNGIEMFEFETRMGASHEQVAVLLKDISALLDKMS